ncbi:Serine/threonine-protein kinase ulk2 [Tritrichomonas musculus]|uniref:Serine/threonine-protein kinase ulk2 n=1 Tax=Tritrichomonas musculus TaxID=1915356 RepID=A0ABR2HVM9_9EUKA
MSIKPFYQPNDKIGKYVIESLISSKFSDCQSLNEVYKAFIPNEGKQYYVIKPTPYETSEDKEYFNQQIFILDQLKDYDTIMNFIDCIEEHITVEEDNKVAYMFPVMKFCNFSDLRDYYNISIRKKDLKTKNMIIRSVFHKTLSILKIIHSLGIIHHDIKPNNFLVESGNPLKIVLTDFEFAIQLPQGQSTNCPCGTLHYMAPEVLEEDYHDSSIDIWSLGVMIYYFVTEKYPFKITNKDEKRATFIEKINNYRPTFNSKVPPDLKDLLLKMLVKNPSDRITAEEALAHPYFNGYYDDESDTKQAASEISVVVEEEISAGKLDKKDIEGEKT